MRWLTPIILIVVLLTAACGHDPGGKDKIAVIDWDKAFSAHPKQTVLKQGEAELQKLLRYREEQAEIAKTQIAGLTRLQQLKQNSKANFLDAGFQTQMYAAEAKERKKLLDAYDAAVKEAGYTKVILRPLMVVAGDHANNDMAGDDDDSWKSQFVASGNFESVDCQIAGLGEIDAIQQIYVAHTKAAIDSLGDIATTASADSDVLADGTYSAKFDTDSSMFHVNEAYDGRGTLTVKNGKMTLHIVMPSQNIVNLFLGTAEDAQKDGAKLIQPTTEEVTYSDGSKEEVYAFDVPVEALDQEFDLALIGTKGKWYDHKVSVSDAKAE